MIPEIQDKFDFNLTDIFQIEGKHKYIALSLSDSV